MANYNNLKDEQSLHLKQHQDDPVHWRPYGPEAIQLAKDENKPILLSIGFSADYWCHVMKVDSFNQPEIAEILNNEYVCIKVDREEYPDLDHYYQQACHLYSNCGGWPLTAFLLPDMRPFYVGTFFSSQSSKNSSGFKDILLNLKQEFTNNRDKIEENASKAVKSIEEGFIPKDKVEYEGHFPHPMSILNAVKEFEDKENGGYGGAPKFPNYSFYEWAIEQIMEGIIIQDKSKHIVQSLEKMLMGGLLDHARGGVHRFATDPNWRVPRFEKILYDQAGLLRLLAKLGNIYPSPLVFDGLINTLDYLDNEMLSEDFYFFSNQSAYSEDVEGLYFTYTKEEFEDLVNSIDLDSEQVCKWFNITAEGNFSSRLNTISLSHQHGKEIFTQEGWDNIRKVRKALLDDRKNRIPPTTDSKGIAGWNFQIISALCDVIQYSRIDIITQMARNLLNKTVEPIFKKFVTEENEIIHSTTQKSSLPYFENYVFYADALLRVYEITSKDKYKSRLQETLKTIFEKFINEEGAFTRAIELDEAELYPNQKCSSFDVYFKSPLACLFGLTRRASLLFGDPELMDPLTNIKEDFIHEILKNPLSSGEALRALSYPSEAYRTLSAPREWANNKTFQDFCTYFLPRFVFDFHDENDHSWEIRNMEKGELHGEGLEDFVKTLTPAKAKE